MKSKTLVKYWFQTVFLLLFSIGIFNYTIDPFWCFSHSNYFNQHQPGFNERQQKTNRLCFTGAKKYNALLLGSSRTAYINQHDFKSIKVYNYAVNLMTPWEYEGWIKNANSIKGKNFDIVIIGVDFFGTAKNLELKWKKKFHYPAAYLKKCKKPFYCLKTLLSFDALKYSIESIKRTYKPTISDFDRKNVRHATKVDKNQKLSRIEHSISTFKKPLLENYVYNKENLLYFKNIKKSYPSTRFIIFTTPVSKKWFDVFVKNPKQFDAYIRWLQELVVVFGKVYHFMDINSVTTDFDNFFDAHHLYPEKAKYIAWRLTDPDNPELPEDFGKILTK